MSYVASALREFYQKAPRCPDVQGKNERSGGWECRLTGKLCGPRSCPKEPELVASLEERAKIQIEEPNRLQVKHTAQEPSIPQTVVSGSSEAVLSSQKLSLANGLVKREPKKVNGKHLTASILFTYKGSLQRWRYKVIFSGAVTKPSVYVLPSKKRGQFEKTSFRFPPGTGTEAIKSVVCGYFQDLGIHDTSAKLNIMGSPESYAVDIVNDD